MWLTIHGKPSFQIRHIIPAILARIGTEDQILRPHFPALRNTVSFETSRYSAAFAKLNHTMFTIMPPLYDFRTPAPFRRCALSVAITEKVGGGIE
jgi:hypothetical protein